MFKSSARFKKFRVVKTTKQFYIVTAHSIKDAKESIHPSLGGPHYSPLPDRTEVTSVTAKMIEAL